MADARTLERWEREQTIPTSDLVRFYTLFPEENPVDGDRWERRKERKRIAARRRKKEQIKAFWDAVKREVEAATGRAQEHRQLR